MGKDRDVERLSAENIKLKDQYADLKKDNLCLTQTIRRKDERIAELKQQLKKEKEQGKLKDAKISALEALVAELRGESKRKDEKIHQQEEKIAHDTALMNRNGTNTGMSTAVTPINQKKRIPNSREKTDRNKGGQPGHEKHSLCPFDDEEATDTVECPPETMICDKCGGSLEKPGNTYARNLLLTSGQKEYEKGINKGFADDERKLLAQIEKYMENHFMWVRDFRLPITNNYGERFLRCVKSYMKASGQFENIQSAKDYALIRTYIMTCRLNGINEMEALWRLANGNPYTLEEILNTACVEKTA